MRKKPLDRETELVTALEYDSYGNKRLTDFDRMFIHKERSAIINGYKYTVPDHVEEKIQAILLFINLTNWKKPKE